MKYVFYVLGGLGIIIGNPISSIIATVILWPNYLVDMFFPIKLILAVVFCFLWNLILIPPSAGLIMIGNKIGE